MCRCCDTNIDLSFHYVMAHSSYNEMKLIKHPVRPEKNPQKVTAFKDCIHLWKITVVKVEKEG